MTAIVWTATMWLGGAAAADPDGPQDEVTQPAQPVQPSRPGGVEKPADDAVTGWRPVRPELDVAEVIGIRPDRVKRLAHRGSGKLWAVPIVPIGPTEFELPGGALHSHPALRVARRIWVNVANYGSNEATHVRFDCHNEDGQRVGEWEPSEIPPDGFARLDLWHSHQILAKCLLVADTPVVVNAYVHVEVERTDVFDPEGRRTLVPIDDRVVPLPLTRLD